MRTKEQIAAYKKAYQIANKEIIKKRKMVYYIANREAALKRSSDYSKSHPVIELARDHKRRAKNFGVKIGNAVAILSWLEGWKASASIACHYCKKAAPGINMTIDHVIPMSKGGDHDLNNLVVCCKSCNSSKHNKLPDVWLAQINL